MTIVDEGRRIGTLMKAALQAGSRSRFRRPGMWMEIGVGLTREYCPLATGFVVGCAQGSGLSFDDVFACWYEELADATGALGKTDQGCTDIVIVRPDGVVVAHTNDVDRGAPVHVDRISVPGRPRVTMVFSGGTPSAAANDRGMVFSGNQVDARDTRPGIPRQVLYFESCFSRDIESASRILLHPLRASSFNNVLADARGRAVCLEASATRARTIVPVDGVMTHTNHYLATPEVEARVGDNIAQSRRRLERATSAVSASTSDDELLALMASHGRGGLCRHGDTQTRFGVLFRPARREMLLGIGNPCQARYRRLTV